ncbi:hypothetical protein [Bosea sp. NBC_00550]|uniref:hypothetical protein n=1 Tax=Bosea sp. NBC_00550 TaxID=2969621 RepID=UPI00222EF855|nr:hypothetical protein [Bosea sp. NBC_00550]UZF92189.1 hypothetical protein NWE53_24495 [Bosea sp. NBC_00550]
MKIPNLRATFKSLPSEGTAVAWQQIANPPERIEQPGVTAVAGKARANRMLANLGKLQGELQAAFDAQVGEIAPRDRSRFIIAQMAIANYLQGENLPARLCREIAELAYALDDLDNGLTPPLLKEATVRETGGNKTDVGEIWRARAYIAVAAGALIAAGFGKGTTYKRIAKQISSVAHHLTDGTNIPRVIERWVAVFAEGRCPNEPAQVCFQTGQNLIARFRSERPDSNEIEVADRILKLASDLAGGSAYPTGYEESGDR